MEAKNKTYKEKGKKKSRKRDLIQGNRNILAKEFDFGSRIISRFAVCTLLGLVGCYWSYPLILVSNISLTAMANVMANRNGVILSNCRCNGMISLLVHDTRGGNCGKWLVRPVRPELQPAHLPE